VGGKKERKGRSTSLGGSLAISCRYVGKETEEKKLAKEGFQGGKEPSFKLSIEEQQEGWAALKGERSRGLERA